MLTLDKHNNRIYLEVLAQEDGMYSHSVWSVVDLPRAGVPGGKLLELSRVRQVGPLSCRRTPKISREVRNSAVCCSLSLFWLVTRVVNHRLFTLVVHVEKVNRWHCLLSMKTENMPQDAELEEYRTLRYASISSFPYVILARIVSPIF